MSNTSHRLRLRTLHQGWKRYQSSRYVLRSQLGFSPQSHSSCPAVCIGCRYYHGQSYGQNQAHRSPLICAMHPRGWEEEAPCPDWQEEPPP